MRPGANLLPLFALLSLLSRLQRREIFHQEPVGEDLTLTHILLGKLKIIGRDTDQSFRIRVMPQEIRYPS